MKRRIAALIATLRRAEIAVSVAEAMDAAQAAAIAGVERLVLREALAATLIKDERDRAVFLGAFEATFPARVRDLPADARGKRGRSAASGGDSGGVAGKRGAAVGSPGAARGGANEPGEETEFVSTAIASDGNASPSEPTRGEGSLADEGVECEDQAAARAASISADDAEGAGFDHAGVVRERQLMHLPFRAMTATDVEACADLARAIAERVTARVRRRLAPRKTGRLDFRRTIRAAVPRGGIPFERHYRGRRPGVPDLVALCDLSASTAMATEFFLSLLAPTTRYFRHVRLFGFVDRLVEIEFVDGQVRPAAPIDLMARSDFGRVLKDLVAEPIAPLGADTVLLILGDARNNRRPPRPDLLAVARAQVRRLLWLNPDPPARWNGGDSVMATYARHADAVVACGTLVDLERALAAVTKM